MFFVRFVISAVASRMRHSGWHSLLSQKYIEFTWNAFLAALERQDMHLAEHIMIAVLFNVVFLLIQF